MSSITTRFLTIGFRTTQRTAPVTQNRRNYVRSRPQAIVKCHDGVATGDRRAQLPPLFVES